VVSKPEADNSVESHGNSEGTVACDSEVAVKGHDDRAASGFKGFSLSFRVSLSIWEVGTGPVLNNYYLCIVFVLTGFNSQDCF